jgi:orsellinic acid C2-O-methyltransferase
MAGTEALSPPDAETSRRLLELIGASWMTQAITAAAELRIADRLAAHPLTADELAPAVGCHPASLRRLLRALASLDVTREQDDGSFALTDMGALLRSDRQPSLRSWAMWWGHYLWPIWGDLQQSVKSGRSRRELATGRSGYAHLEADPEAAAVFNAAMVELTALSAAELNRAVDFSTARHVIDVGGGYGELLAAILRAHPALRGTLFELPHALAGARARMQQAGVADRCEFVGGDFFESVPGGGDLYLLKSVLHNWDDDKCGVILRRCRQSMRRDARLLLVERVLPQRMRPCAADRAAARTDLNMLIGVGGRERNRAEFALLLGAAGFTATRFVPTPLELSVIEATIA